MDTVFRCQPIRLGLCTKQRGDRVLANISHVIHQVGVVLEDCPQVGAEDVSKLKDMGEAFLHPKKLIIEAFHNVEVNGVKIYKDIKQAGKDIDNNQWEAAGEIYGTVGATVLWGAQDMESMK